MAIMKAVIMAGGRGSRLNKLKGQYGNKHTLLIYDKPMILYVVETLIKGGVNEILVVFNLHHTDLVAEIIATNITDEFPIYYRYITEVNGPGRQLFLAEKWVRDEDFVLMLGDSIFFTPLDFTDKKAPHIWTMPLGDLDDPSKYGQVKTAGNKVLELKEKPKELFSPIIQTGIWFLPADAFEKARLIGETVKGEIHIGDLSMEYVQEGRVTHTPLPAGSYLDVGTPEALYKATVMMHDLCQKKKNAL